MTTIDPIADMLTRIRNAQKADHSSVRMPSSKLKLAIIKILKEEGYVKDAIQNKNGAKTMLEVVLKKIDKQYAIAGIERTSKPGQRVYVSKSKIPNVLNGCGIAIISTSQGIMTSTEAKKRGLGGEVICEVW